MECELLGRKGSFSWWLQVFLIGACMTSLVGKRFTDTVRRPWKVWFFDSSKQGVQAAMVHFINIGLSVAFGEFMGTDSDPCNWYWINLTLDCTFGVAIIFLLLRLLQWIYCLKCVGRPELARCGDYGDPPSCRLFLRQLFDYQARMVSFVRLPDYEPGVLRKPIELPEGLGEIFKSLTPSFLREEEEPDVFSRCCPQITLRQRLLGWFCCFGLGLLLQAASFSAVTRALLGHPGRFAVTYTLGNLVALTGTFFLAGPAKQCRNMTKHNRLAASIIFVAAMFLTLFSAEAKPFHGQSLLVMLMVLLQWLALVWYTLSFIPYGRKLSLSVLQRCLWWCCEF